jgi:hypothetical protein
MANNKPKNKIGKKYGDSLIVALPAPAYNWVVTTSLLVTQGER